MGPIVKQWECPALGAERIDEERYFNKEDSEEIPPQVTEQVDQNERQHLEKLVRARREAEEEEEEGEQGIGP